MTCKDKCAQQLTLPVAALPFGLTSLRLSNVELTAPQLQPQAELEKLHERLAAAEAQGSVPPGLKKSVARLEARCSELQRHLQQLGQEQQQQQWQEQQQQQQQQQEQEQAGHADEQQQEVAPASELRQRRRPLTQQGPASQPQSTAAPRAAPPAQETQHATTGSSSSSSSSHAVQHHPIVLAVFGSLKELSLSSVECPHELLAAALPVCQQLERLHISSPGWPRLLFQHVLLFPACVAVPSMCCCCQHV